MICSLSTLNRHKSLVIQVSFSQTKNFSVKKSRKDHYPALLMLVQKLLVLNAFRVPEFAKLARTSSPILIDSTLPANGSTLQQKNLF